MDVTGYAFIKKDAKTAKGVDPKKLPDFLGQTVRVMEFADDGGALVISPKGDCLAMFEKEDIKTKFKCTVQGEIICPPDIDPFEQIIYSAKAMSRKGGYGPIIKQMVIAASLHKGTFNDNFLWQKQ